MPQRWNELDVMPVSSSTQASLIHSTTLRYPGDFTLPADMYDFGAVGDIYFCFNKVNCYIWLWFYSKIIILLMLSHGLHVYIEKNYKL